MRIICVLVLSCLLSCSPAAPTTPAPAKGEATAKSADTGSPPFSEVTDPLEQIIGVWEVLKPGDFISSARLEFTRDGKLVFKGKVGETMMIKNGTFTIKGASLEMVIGPESDKKTETVQIKKLDNTSLIFSDKPGEFTEFKRISIVTRITLDDKVTKVEVASEEVEIDRGVQVKIKKSRTIQHDVGFETTARLESELEVKGGVWIAEVRARVKGEIGNKIGRKYSESETIEQEVSLDGNVNTKYKLVWIEKYRTGKSMIIEDGKRIELPFKFREGADLLVKAVK